MAHWASTTNWASSSGEMSSCEPDLVKAAQQGDKSAFQQLISRYDRLVLAFALNVTRSEEQARQIYELVFVEAFKKLGTGQAHGSLFVWVYRIAANRCQRFLASEGRRSGRWRSGCTELSVRERLVFILTQYGHLRASTIAEILNVSEVSVKEALVRAVYKLKTNRQAA